MTINVIILVITLIAVEGNNITLESYDSIGSQSSIMITTPDFENDTRTDEIIDVEVNENGVRVRLHLEGMLSRIPILLISPNITPPPDIDIQDIQDDQRSATPCASVKKYRLESEIGQRLANRRENHGYTHSTVYMRGSFSLPRSLTRSDSQTWNPCRHPLDNTRRS
jgi:hypothetical protein